MCFKKLFGGHDPVAPVVIEPANRRLLSFTINDYAGSINDLNGCNNDGKQLKETLLNYWSDFDVRRFMDHHATLDTFKSEVNAAIKVLDPGATVLVLPDSCFSGTVTRLFNSNEDYPTRNRFYQQPGVKMYPRLKPGTFAARGDIKWICISGCGETEYSADAYIDNEYHGAFTFYACTTLRPGITYRQWHKEICKYLPGTQFEQSPSIEGPDYLLDQIVFSKPTLIIHNSTHGTQLAGNGGDEPIDEAICLYDGNLRDDDYNSLLMNII
jgi:hypothetical protein